MLLGGCATVGTKPQAPVEIPEASVRAHMGFLASDALNGRGSGTRDEWITAEYIAAQARRLGLQPLGDAGGFVQDVRIERSMVAGTPALAAGELSLANGTDFSLGTTTAAKVVGPLQVARAGVPVAAGAALYVPAGVAVPSDSWRAALVLTAESAPARARRLQGIGVGRPVISQAIVGTPARASIALFEESLAAFAALAEGTPVSLESQLEGTTTRHTWNVLAALHGKAVADEVILLSAHLDHLGARAAAAPAGPATPAASGQGDAPASAPAPAADMIFNGADDDASGTIAVLEIAEALARGPRLDRTVIFTWFGSEEAGGFGARHFIDAPPVPLERIVANLEFEMVGRPDAAVPADALWLTGYERSDLGAELAAHGARLVADPHPEQNFFARSDNIQLARRGVVAQTVSSFGLHPDYHRASDEIETIDFAHLTRSIGSMVGPIRWLAGAGYRPRWREGMRP